MKILISIDDTDDIGTKGTGEILEDLCAELTHKFNGKFSRVTRHQLLIHEDIKYTSHNSSMCCEGIIESHHFASIKESAAGYLKDNSASNSDPGLCIVDLENITSESKNILISWGIRAKKEVLTKKAAFTLASETGVHLSEHGGTGDGIIGALAGAGLRLTGNDGRFKGKFDLKTDNGYLSVKKIVESRLIDKVTDEKFIGLDPEEKVLVGDKLKTVMHDHKSILIVRKNSDGCWVNLSRKELKEH